MLALARFAVSSWEQARTVGGLGSYRGHEGRPVTGLHIDVENDTLGNQTSFGPDEVAGATRIDLGSIAPAASALVRVLLSIRSDDISPNSVTVGACARIQNTGGDPILKLDKGACGGSVPNPTWDLVVGDLRAFTDPFGSTPLGNVFCIANDVAQDRVSFQTLLSDCRKSVFVLARRGSGLQFDYGTASDGSVRYTITGNCP